MSIGQRPWRCRSSSPDGGYDLTNQARDLAGLLDDLHIKAAHIIGSSAGGPIVLTFAALYPRRVRSLVLVGTAIDLFPMGEPGSDEVRRQLVVLARDGEEAAFDQRPPSVEFSFNELWDEPEAIARGMLEAYRARVQRRREQARDMPRATRVHYYSTELRSMEAYLSTGITAYAQAVTAPTLVYHGSRDQMVPIADAQRLAQTIPGAVLELMVDGPHSLLIRSAAARQHVIAWMRQAS